MVCNKCQNGFIRVSESEYRRCSCNQTSLELRGIPASFQNVQFSDIVVDESSANIISTATEFIKSFSKGKSLFVCSGKKLRMQVLSIIVREIPLSCYYSFADLLNLVMEPYILNYNLDLIVIDDILKNRLFKDSLYLILSERLKEGSSMILGSQYPLADIIQYFELDRSLVEDFVEAK